MEFKEFNKKMAKHVAKMSKGKKQLYVVDIDPYDLWDRYLDSFPQGKNEIFRERREHDCSCCRQYIKAVGNVVSIGNDGKVTTMWDFETDDPDCYQVVVDTLAEVVRSRPIANALCPEERTFGVEKNHEMIDGRSHTWHHFCTSFHKSVQVYPGNQAAARGQIRDSRNVLERSFNEISLEALDAVLELIYQNSLYRGEEWKGALTQFRKLHVKYHGLAAQKRDVYCWSAVDKAGPAVSRIKNHSIGVLLTDITQGVDLDKAVTRYEKIVAPANYKRPKAIFSKKMVQQAEKTVKELGFEKSLGRRYAQLSDITINNVLWANRDAKSKMGGSVFDQLSDSVPNSSPPKFDRVEEVPIETFISDILPGLSSLEVMVENDHLGNFVSLISPQDDEAPSMFKWDNGFSWAYSGNVTDSMKQRVKAAGGDVEGDLRFSISWNENDDCRDDLDAHCKEPGGFEIYYGRKRSGSGGQLDVDIITPHGPAVENITWPTRARMEDGVYKFWVNNYTSRSGKSGFSAEIEFDGQIHEFSYPSPLRNRENIQVAEVMLKKGNFSLKPILPSQSSSREKWGVTTQKFHPVSACMFSPNHWDDEGIGHRHYFFMLEGCENDESPNGFFNEFLTEVLTPHKRVFEALGLKMAVAESESQLSGLGFSATKRSSLVVRAKGSVDRVIRLTF